MLFTFRWGGTGGSESPASCTTFSRLPYFCKLQMLFTFRWGGGGRGGSESPASCTTFSRLPYFCFPLPPDSHPWLCCPRLQVNQSLTFKLSQNLTFLSIFWPLFWREDHRTDESYYRSVFLIKLSLAWLSQFDHRFWRLVIETKVSVLCVM